MILVRPDISVVIPFHNAGKFFPEALRSVKSQTLSPLEIIVVDDGSDEPDRKLLENLKGFSLIRQQNRGPAAARNTGIIAASGQFIAFLDADDLWLPDTLSSLYECIMSDPEIGGVIGKVQLLWERPKENMPEKTEKLLNLPFFALLFGTALLRKKTIEDVGFLNENLRFGEDTDFFLRMREQDFSLSKSPSTVLRYRLHEGNMTKGKNPADLNVMLVLKKSLDRRRAKQTKQFSELEEGHQQ